MRSGLAGHSEIAKKSIKLALSDIYSSSRGKKRDPGLFLVLLQGKASARPDSGTS